MYTLALVDAKNERANEALATIGAVALGGAMTGGIMLQNGTVPF